MKEVRYERTHGSGMQHTTTLPAQRASPELTRSLHHESSGNIEQVLCHNHRIHDHSVFRRFARSASAVGRTFALYDTLLIVHELRHRIQTSSARPGQSPLAESRHTQPLVAPKHLHTQLWCTLHSGCRGPSRGGAERSGQLLNRIARPAPPFMPSPQQPHVAWTARQIFVMMSV